MVSINDRVKFELNANENNQAAEHFTSMCYVAPFSSIVVKDHTMMNNVTSSVNFYPLLLCMQVRKLVLCYLIEKTN